VVVEALLGEGLARPVAGSGDCWISLGCFVPGECCWSPAPHGVGRLGDLSAGAEGSCLLIGLVARSGCGKGVLQG